MPSTAQKVFVFGVIVVHIFLHSDWIQTRITPYTEWRALWDGRYLLFSYETWSLYIVSCIKNWEVIHVHIISKFGVPNVSRKILLTMSNVNNKISIRYGDFSLYFAQNTCRDVRKRERSWSLYPVLTTTTTPIFQKFNYLLKVVIIWLEFQFLLYFMANIGDRNNW